MADCEHKLSRLWSTKKGVVRRCRDCGAIQKPRAADLQQVKKDK